MNDFLFENCTYFQEQVMGVPSEEEFRVLELKFSSPVNSCALAIIKELLICLCKNFFTLLCAV